MISIVISTYRSNYLENLKKNITATIGTDFEIIAIDNNAKKGLCEVYNSGTRQAKYPIICYLHEDVSIKTLDWGKIVVQLFNTNENLGLVGIAGSTYKPAVPSGWSFPWASHHLTTCINILQFDKQTNQVNHVYSNPKKQSITKVASVDGVWFCSRKETALKIPFDEKTFTGFHCYDVDFSLSVLQKYEVAVTYEVLIEHFSKGSFNKEWVDETLKLHRKWQCKLPVNLQRLTSEQQSREEEFAFKYLLSLISTYNGIDSSIFKILWTKALRSKVDNKTFLKMNAHAAKQIWKQYLVKKKI